MGRVGRTAVALSFGVVAALAAASCGGSGFSDEDCDYVLRRCRTICDYYSCSYYWGCCWDQCWYECIGDGKRDPAPGVAPAPSPTTPAPAPSADGSAPPPPPPTDGGAGGSGILCSPCTSNDDCKAGALCIQRGGEIDGGASSAFCGHACASSAECPAEFTCVEIGSSRQCVPTSGVCS